MASFDRLCIFITLPFVQAGSFSFVERNFFEEHNHRSCGEVVHFRHYLSRDMQWLVSGSSLRSVRSVYHSFCRQRQLCDQHSNDSVTTACCRGRLSLARCLHFVTLYPDYMNKRNYNMDGILQRYLLGPYILTKAGQLALGTHDISLP